MKIKKIKPSDAAPTETRPPQDGSNFFNRVKGAYITAGIKGRILLGQAISDEQKRRAAALEEPSPSDKRDDVWTAVRHADKEYDAPHPDSEGMTRSQYIGKAVMRVLYADVAAPEREPAPRLTPEQQDQRNFVNDAAASFPAARPPIHSQHCAVFQDDPCNCGCEPAVRTEQPTREPIPFGCDDNGLVFTVEEKDAIAEMSKLQDLRPAKVITQAIKTYQFIVKGEAELIFKSTLEKAKMAAPVAVVEPRRELITVLRELKYAVEQLSTHDAAFHMQWKTPQHSAGLENAWCSVNDKLKAANKILADSQRKEGAGDAIKG